MTLKTTVVFRADSGARIGSGHLIRCLTLGTELRRRGADVIFVGRRQAGHLIDRVAEAGFE